VSRGRRRRREEKGRRGKKGDDMWVHIMGKIDFSQHDLCFRRWSCYLYQTHLFSTKGRVQLHGGAANWWSCCSRVGLVELEPSQSRPKIEMDGSGRFIYQYV
jgi:hypothetical protein